MEFGGLEKQLTSFGERFSVVTCCTSDVHHCLGTLQIHAAYAGANSCMKECILYIKLTKLTLRHVLLAMHTMLWEHYKCIFHED